MAPKEKSGEVTVNQRPFVVPDITIKELLGAIPCVPHHTSLSYPLTPLITVLTVSNVPPSGRRCTCMLFISYFLLFLLKPRPQSLGRLCDWLHLQGYDFPGHIH